MILFRKAVLIIHGFAGGTYDEEKLANFLERHAKLDVYSFTLPGHEKRTFKTVKYQEWIKESEDMLNRLINYGYKDIYLIGHSMGGVIATYLASKYKRVKKLVLAAPAFNYLVANDESNAIEKVKKGMGAIKNNDKDEILTRFLKLPLTSINEFTKLVKKYKKSYLDVRIPVLIVQGNMDTLVPLESSLNIYEELLTKKKKIVVLKNITHDIFRENSEEAFVEIEKFLL
ncbi:MAG: alpha/beta hydrolase [Bacilli bacterium]